MTIIASSTTLPSPSSSLPSTTIVPSSNRKKGQTSSLASSSSSSVAAVRIQAAIPSFSPPLGLGIRSRSYSGKKKSSSSLSSSLMGKSASFAFKSAPAPITSSAISVSTSISTSVSVSTAPQSSTVAIAANSSTAPSHNPHTGEYPRSQQQQKSEYLSSQTLFQQQQQQQQYYVQEKQFESSQNGQTHMQPTAKCTDSDHPVQTSHSYSISSSIKEAQYRSSSKRHSFDNELQRHHPGSYSTAMGPMGSNENHGPTRNKVHPSQSHAHDNTGSLEQEEKQCFTDNEAKYQQKQDRGRGKHKDHSDGVDDEEDQPDEDMESDGDRSQEASDEENVDELMDEGEFEEGDLQLYETGNGSGLAMDRQGQEYQGLDSNRLSMQNQSQSRPLQQQQYLPQMSRPLPNILPRPESSTQSDLYTVDERGHDGDMSRQGKAVPATETSGTNDGERVSKNSNSSSNSNNNTNSDLNTINNINSNINNSSNTTTASSNSASTATNVGVNNGSSKKRTTPAKHKCPQCDKYFTRPFNLKSHQRTHTQERPFVCSFTHCARAFSRLHDCNRHMRTHWRIKPYSCPECHRNFVRQDALTRHLRLDFGHNRCSGYPGPSPGTGANPEKTDESADDAMLDTPTETLVKTEREGTMIQPSAPLSSRSSPPTPNQVGPMGSSRIPYTETPEMDKKRPLAPMTGDIRTTLKSNPPPESQQIMQELKEEREHSVHHGMGVQARYSSASVAPISFVHRGTPAERRAATPTDGREGSSLPPQHARSVSLSSFTQSQPPIPTPHVSSPMNPVASTGPPMGPLTSGSSPRHATLDRRATAPILRTEASWAVHGHEPVSPRTGEFFNGAPPRQPAPGHAMDHPENVYGPEYDHAHSRTRPMAEYPSSFQDPRRSSPEPRPPSEWDPSRQGNPGQWGWDHRSQESKYRHPTWSSIPPNRASLPHQQLDEQPPRPSLMPPPRASTMDSWPRSSGHLSHDPRDEMISREPRDGPMRMMPSTSSSSYSSSPYSREPGTDGHIRVIPSGAPANMRPNESFRRSEQERDPRQRSMTDMDHVRRSGMSWSEQRSRSYHEQDGAMDARPRFDSHAGSFQRTHEHAVRPPTGEAVSSLPEPHIYSGMAGAERMYPESAPYHERDQPRDPVGSYSMHDYRPTRSHSAMEYESERSAMQRQARFVGEPKPLLHDARRSMSPVPLPLHRHSTMDDARLYDAGGSRYPYSMERKEPYSREDMERMSSRSFRHEERIVMSPVPREETDRDHNGYFGMTRSYHDPRSYAPPPQRLSEAHHRHPDPRQESIRRERHSIDAPPGVSGLNATPPSSKRSLSAATLASR